MAAQPHPELHIEPANPSETDRVIGDVIALRPDEIDATGRLRPIDEAWADALGGIMLEEGQLDPIWVSRQKGPKRWKLVAGGHRHRGAELKGIETLRAIEVDAAVLSRRQAEVAENLHRLGLAPIDRAAFIAELHDVLRARSGLLGTITPQEIAANARWKRDLRQAAGDASDIMSRAYGFTSEIAEQYGFSKRSIERDLMLARRLSPQVRESLRGHPVAANATQLRALAKLDLDEQQAVALRLTRGAKTVAEAIAFVRGRAPANPEDKRLSAFIGAFARMSLTEKKGALAQLAGMLPAGFRLAEGEA
jgi:ParB family chromosome partitioning protein